MTREEKRLAIKKYCDERNGCVENETFTECPLWKREANDCYESVSDEVLDEHYKILFGEPIEIEEPEELIEQEDVINHPSHYCREGGMESIDEMLLVFGKQAVMNFCLCNVWKYRYRASDKNGEEDLHKSDWYMRKYKELADSNFKELEELLKNTPITLVNKENTDGERKETL